MDFDTNYQLPSPHRRAISKIHLGSILKDLVVTGAIEKPEEGAVGEGLTSSFQV